MDGYYVGHCEECGRVIAATSVQDDRLNEVAEAVADMIRVGLIVYRRGKWFTARIEGHSTKCELTESERENVE